MEDWEFLRRPPAKEGKKDPPKQEVKIKVLFAGEEKVYSLLESDTFEQIYADYESKLKTSILLHYNSSLISRYAKTKLLLKKDPSPTIRVVIQKEPPVKKDPVKYKIRYNRDKYIEIEITEEITTGDLLKTALSRIPHHTTSHHSNTFLEFDGDTLTNNQPLQEYLQNGDLLDLIFD